MTTTGEPESTRGRDARQASASWSVGLDTASFAAIEHEITAFFADHGVTGRAAFVSQMVIEEIVRNLIEHTPPYAQDEQVEIHVDVDEAAATVRIDDTRPPFEPDDAPALAVDVPLEQRRAGGMGLHLVRNMVDELTYARLDDGNRLTARVART